MKLYNGGQKFDEHVRFHRGGPQGGTYGYVQVKADEQAFFEVPSELLIDGERIPVEFAKDLAEKYGDRGVVLIDKNLDAKAIEREDKEMEESDRLPKPIAASDEAAKEKGDKIFQKYVEKIANDHLLRCERLRSQAMAPQAATGFTKYCLRRLGIADPAATSIEAANTKNVKVDEMQSQIDSLMKLVAQLQGAEPKPKRA